jgi:hypothetical protein
MPSRARYAEEIHLWLWQYTDEFGKRVESSWHRTEATVREFAHHVLIFSQAVTQELVDSPEISDVAVTEFTDRSACSPVFLWLSRALSAHQPTNALICGALPGNPANSRLR